MYVYMYVYACVYVYVYVCTYILRKTYIKILENATFQHKFDTLNQPRRVICHIKEYTKMIDARGISHVWYARDISQ